MSKRLNGGEERFAEAVKDKVIDALEPRLGSIDSRLDAVEERLDALDERLSDMNFLWLEHHTAIDRGEKWFRAISTMVQELDKRTKS